MKSADSLCGRGVVIRPFVDLQNKIKTENMTKQHAKQRKTENKHFKTK